MSSQLIADSTELHDATTITPTIVTVDRSYSIKPHLEELKAGFDNTLQGLKLHPISNATAEVAIITYSDKAEVFQPFRRPMEIESFPELTAGGTTNIAAAVDLGLTVLEERKQAYRKVGSVNAPLYFFISDGHPTSGGSLDYHRQTISKVRKLEEQKKLSAVFPIAIGDFDMEFLSEFSSKRRPLRVKDGPGHLIELFKFIEASIEIASTTAPSEEIELDPETLKTWADLR